MFDNLSQRLTRIVKELRGQGRLTDENIQSTLRELRMALLEADVALPVVRWFVEHVRTRAVGEEVVASLTPGQAFIRVVRNELTALMGEQCERLDLNRPPPTVVLMVGLQGSGKTTSAAKLARYLKEREKKSVLMVSCDVHRPAAIDQLSVLASEIGVECYPADPAQDPAAIASEALAHAKRRFHDVLIVDTAGRLHIDAEMMDEITRLHRVLDPAETLFVVDSMTGQDAVNAAQAFDAALPLTGVILTKTDGDARGGAALSVRHVTGKPVKFVGAGEKSTALEPFYPDRVAARILGMGDVLGLIEEVERKIDREQAMDMAEKLHKGQGFDLRDFRDQIRQMRGVGDLGSLMSRLPGLSDVPQHMMDQVNDKELGKTEAIINSMTPKERRYPDNIKASHKRRIAAGSGTQIQDVNRLLKQFTQMQRTMKQVSKKGGLGKLMRSMSGRVPPA
ncbi:MAG: Signal recognition particle protein [Chromatiales bacterium USCg_Taylor]|nr:MAG: Signal recognition particle protein [Chromatiales bacterium USCg_Taylor]